MLQQHNQQVYVYFVWTHCLQAQQYQQWDGGHASLYPLLQWHSAIVIIVDLLHHFLEDLQTMKMMKKELKTRMTEA